MFIAFLSGFVAGGALAIVLMGETIVKKVQKQRDEAVEGWGLALLLCKQLNEQLGTDSVIKDGENIISPIQFGRDGS